jgi:hypothetical protein
MKGFRFLLAGGVALAFACANSDDDDLLPDPDAGAQDAGEERRIRRDATPDALPDGGPSDAPLDGLGCRALPVPDNDAGEDCLPFQSDMCEPCMDASFAYLCKYGTSPKLSNCARPPFDQGAADADSIFACCPTLKCTHYSFNDGLYCGATREAFTCLDDGGSLPPGCEYQDASGVYCCPGPDQ